MTRARRARRRGARGFTLLELMVVVVLIAILAAIASPSMSRARNDQLTFDYARRGSELLHAARSRAVGRGAAHLALFQASSTYGGTSGAVVLFEALDGTAAPGGPNPLPSCRAADWSYALTWAPGTAADTTGRTALVEAVNVSGGSSSSAIQTVEQIQMVGYTVDGGGAKTVAPVVALCVTPNGTSYVTSGSTATQAITALATAQPFTGIFELDVARHDGAAVVGLTRRILVGGGGQPRIKSE